MQIAMTSNVMNRPAKPGDFRLGEEEISCRCTPCPLCAVTVSVTVFPRMIFATVTVYVTHKPFVRFVSVVTAFGEVFICHMPVVRVTDFFGAPKPRDGDTN